VPVLGAAAAEGASGAEADQQERERFGLTPDWIISTACYKVFKLEVSSGARVAEWPTGGGSGSARCAA
jgi:hypothetical protein